VQELAVLAIVQAEDRDPGAVQLGSRDGFNA